MEEKKMLEFYGGRKVSLLPFVIFIVTIITTTFVWSSISDGALWVPAFVALIIPFFFAKDKKYYSEVIIEGMASKDCLVPIVCWIFAGAFSRVLRVSGLASGIAGFLLLHLLLLHCLLQHLVQGLELLLLEWVFYTLLV